MANPNYDPCECVFDQEGAMRRLISLIRNSQTHCTDTQCFQDSVDLQSSNETPLPLILITAWIIMAVLLYLARPSSLHNSHKQNNSNRDSNLPPSPPANL
ncbi:Small integral membrane protein 14 [Trichoplax sp. H2]|nr:Small integral membrane protein 14 [Trichoplax sp. H2]|eukprot:RDD40021.1 Small integral membrane protein 14 [Trichoplax sp. H2]